MQHTRHTTQHNTIQHTSTQHSKTQHTSTQHINITQHTSIQHNIAQRNTTQHNTPTKNTNAPKEFESTNSHETYLKAGWVRCLQLVLKPTVIGIAEDSKIASLSQYPLRKRWWQQFVKHQRANAFLFTRILSLRIARRKLTES